ncbi:hypothetical protein [Frankia sp. CiP3]|uniref:hypothetical protein n=1 Tax=Frankia sp. CiP3 TaxID=2880971 RepID=UPI001EF4D71C|nr:hypothetical protein [Frankia sp. CiP3]
MTIISEQPSTGAGHVLVHMVGAADLGTRPGPEFTKKLDELVAADPSEAARLLTESADPRRPAPLVAVFADGAPRYDRVVLVVTRPQAGPAPDENFTRPLGAAIKERLECEGLYGVRFQPGAVELLEVSAPHMSGVRAAIRKRLLRMRADGMTPTADLPFGGGATNGAFGLVAGILEAGVEPCLVLLAGATGKRIMLRRELPDPKENAQRWLVRNRFYSPMAKGDDAGLWRSRLNRQILVTETTDRDGDGGTATGMDEEELARVLLERIGRYETVDGFLFRDWLKTRTRGLAGQDGAGRSDADLDVKLDDLIRRRFPDRATRQAKERWTDTEISALRAARAAKGLPTSALDFLLQPQLPAAEDAAKDLIHGNRVAPKDPQIICRFLQTQNYLPSHDEEIVGIGYPEWPYLGDQRALILIAMGMDKIEGDDPPTPRLDGLIAQTRNVEPVIRIVVSAQTEPVGRLWEAKARARGVDCRVLLECGTDFDDLEAIRCDVWDALDAEGGLDTVGEVRVAVGPGRKQQGLPLLLTGIEWGLSAACPTRLVEIRSDGSGSDRSIVELDWDAVLNRVAGEAELAGVALSALDCLDISAAAAALNQGWARSLRPLAARARRLSLVPVHGGEGRRRTATAGAGAGVDPEWLASIGMPDQENSALLLLCARLRLVETLADSDPWGCAMRADALCEGTLGKSGRYGWNTLKDRKSGQYIPAANKLAEYRNNSPAAHGKEKAARKGMAPPKPPSAKELRDCLRGLRKGLSEHVMVNGQGLPDTWDSVLVDELESLKTKLRAFIVSR